MPSYVAWVLAAVWRLYEHLIGYFGAPSTLKAPRR